MLPLVVRVLELMMISPFSTRVSFVDVVKKSPWRTESKQRNLFEISPVFFLKCIVYLQSALHPLTGKVQSLPGMST